jgi:hypothetical protein
MKIAAASWSWRRALLALLVIFGAGALTAGAVDPAADEGYFLSLQQKGQLLWWGRVEDSAGRWYDVWICPGYVAPTTSARTYLVKSGRQFGEYFAAEKYKRLAEGSGRCFEWAFQDCIGRFVVRGVPEAWGRYMAQAEKRLQRRLFGSLLAYPWAVVQGVGDTLGRVTGGLGGMVLGAATGLTVVPAWYMLDSGVAGTAVFVGQGVALPVAGYAWNTLASPPLALLGGPRPAPSRADGFWVRLVDVQGRRRTELDPAQVSAAVAWGVLLLTEVQPSLEQSANIARETEQKISQIRQEAAAAQQRLQNEADRRAAQFRESSPDPAAPPPIPERQREQIAAALRLDGTIAAPDIPKIMDLIRRYPPPLPPPAPAPRKLEPAKHASPAPAKKAEPQKPPSARRGTPPPAPAPKIEPQQKEPKKAEAKRAEPAKPGPTSPPAPAR